MYTKFLVKELSKRYALRLIDLFVYSIFLAVAILWILLGAFEIFLQGYYGDIG